MIFVIDNYDSFTYNLVQAIGELGATPMVARNDAVEVDAIREKRPNGIIISPGPGRPEDAGISVQVVRTYSGEIPVLGVCLGHQAIGVAFGARVDRTHPLHGKSSPVSHDGSRLFEGVDSPFAAGRYHSLVVELNDVPADLEVSARTEDGIIMAIRHREHRTYGVQFHPESVLTPGGQRLLRNYLEECQEIER